MSYHSIKNTHPTEILARLESGELVKFGTDHAGVVWYRTAPPIHGAEDPSAIDDPPADDTTDDNALPDDPEELAELRDDLLEQLALVNAKIDQVLQDDDDDDDAPADDEDGDDD